ncbi:CBS domain-containing protein [Streptomyces sp. DSM 44917]|uniref:CBS domain-containing protein n=1 Tax=Streptomyces boetiae TaxID=3075541 RepID=A0ABU2L7N5_9ACTN|nr:CBS domain-containing protein [Streptomyces sp. DSM 44917]MDT0307515.1 CBS domain-containing protein [Streptomyces sp. DSM 44917]
MSSPAVGIPPTASLRQAAERMEATGLTVLPVVVEERVTGIVTDRDLAMRTLAGGLLPGNAVETVMTGEPPAVEPATPLPVAIGVLRSARVRHLPVVEAGRLVGMVSFEDLLWCLTQQWVDLMAVVDADRRGGPERMPRAA